MDRRSLPLAAAVLLALSGCPSGSAGGAGAAGEAAGCRILQPSTSLPRGLEESSGVAASREQSGVLWSHNDSGHGPVLHAVRATGEAVGQVRVRRAESDDWEDIALGPCPSGSCLYIADTGDNEARRKKVTLYRLPEPRAGAREARAEAFPVRYPGGARDAEALFVLPDGGVYLVTKGRRRAVTLFRYPPPLRAGETVELEHVADLTAGKPPPQQQVTGASASPSGEWVALRTYRSLLRYRTADLLAGRASAAEVIDLSGVGEAQGEAVEMLDDQRVVLTSEGGFDEAPGTVAVLHCPLPAAPGSE